MTAPQLTVYRQGQGVVSGDGANTFEQTTDTAQDLRSFIGTQGLQVFVRGAAAVNDGGAGVFIWVANGTGPDDGVNVIVPTGAALGCWVRLKFSSFSSVGDIAAIVHTVDGNGSTPSTGVTGDQFVPFNMTLTAVVVLCTQSGSVLLDIWAKPFVVNSPPTSGNSIVGSSPPTVGSAYSSYDAALSGWNTRIQANSQIRYNLSSITTVTRYTVVLVGKVL